MLALWASDPTVKAGMFMDEAGDCTERRGLVSQAMKPSLPSILCVQSTCLGPGQRNVLRPRSLAPTPGTSNSSDQAELGLLQGSQSRA